MPSTTGTGYRLDPAAARSVLAAVDAQTIDRTAVPDALEAALQTVHAVNDALSDDIIFLLGGIAGDLHDAVARIDSRIGRAAHAAAAAISAIEAGDLQMAGDVGSAQQAVEPRAVARFGPRPR